jgi:glycogen debranching enzyme
LITAYLHTFVRAGFSPFNTPHLKPAFELDTAIIEFSASLAPNGLPTHVTSSEDIDTLLSALSSSLAALNLWQYYVLDVQREKSAIKKILLSSAVPPWTNTTVAGKSAEELAGLIRTSNKIINIGRLSSRFCVRIDPEYATSLVKAAFTDIADVDVLAEKWGRVVDVLNVPFYQEADDDLRAALLGIRNRLKYTRLDAHGPKLGEITAE